MAENNKSTDHTILICSKCGKGEAAAKIKAALVGQVPIGYTFRSVDCMAGCERPATVGFQAADKASYLFGNIESQADFNALAEFAHQYQQSADGWTSASERPFALYRKTLARLPAAMGREQL